MDAKNAQNVDLLFRKSQIETLVNLIGDQESDYPWPSIFAYGHTATGKSQTIEAVLRQLQVKHIIINCVEVYYNPKLLFEQILNNVSAIKHSLDNKGCASCSNMNDFVRSLTSLLEESQEKVCLILDKAEKLRDMDSNILPALLKLQEITSQKICTILISELVWEKFRFGTGLCGPYIVHFNEYSKEEMMEILINELSKKKDYPNYFLRNFVQLVLSVTFQACYNLSELNHIVNQNFQKYVQPVENGDASLDDVKKLWRNVEPYLSKSLQTIYFRHSSVKIENDSNEKSIIPLANSNFKNILIELPFYSKYLLIAAYLASYNPSRTDKRFFLKGRDKLKKQSKFIQKHARATNQLLGPKPFPLDRLLAIFYSIVEERVAPTVGIFSQISSLVTLRLLTQIGGDGNLDGAKYKCSVSLDMIRSISRTVDFDIIRYLFDFI